LTNTDNVLEYWKVAESRWPTIARIARDVLAIPAAGVGVERLFNVARDICSYRRYSLKPDTLRLLMILNYTNQQQLREEYRQIHLSEEEQSEDKSSTDEEEEDSADFAEEDRVIELISDGEDTDQVDEIHDINDFDNNTNTTTDDDNNNDNNDNNNSDDDIYLSDPALTQFLRDTEDIEHERNDIHDTIPQERTLHQQSNRRKHQRATSDLTYRNLLNTLPISPIIIPQLVSKPHTSSSEGVPFLRKGRIDNISGYSLPPVSSKGVQSSIPSTPTPLRDFILAKGQRQQSQRETRKERRDRRGEDIGKGKGRAREQ